MLTPEKLHLPKGIQKRKHNKFVVVFMKDDGSVGYKTKDTLEDAIAWQLEQREIVSQCADASQIEDHGCDVAPNEETCEAEEQHTASQMLF